LRLSLKNVVRATLIPLVIGLYGFGALILILLITKFILDIFGQIIAFITMIIIVIPFLYLWYILTKLIRSRVSTKHR